jgi:hypothetical protein
LISSSASTGALGPSSAGSTAAPRTSLSPYSVRLRLLELSQRLFRRELRPQPQIAGYTNFG